MNAAILTNEFQPEIYGGAGIHVKFLTQELSKLCHVEARCFGSQNFDEDNVRAIGFSRKLALNPEDDRFQKISSRSISICSGPPPSMVSM